MKCRVDNEYERCTKAQKCDALKSYMCRTTSTGKSNLSWNFFWFWKSFSLSETLPSEKELIIIKFYIRLVRKFFIYQKTFIMPVFRFYAIESAISSFCKALRGIWGKISSSGFLFVWKFYSEVRPTIITFKHIKQMF